MKNRIRELRKDRNMTMKALGDIIGVAESTVSQYETGKRQPDYETLLQLAEYFGVTVGYLLGAEEKAPAQKGRRDISFDDFTYAFYEESKDLPEEKKKMLLDMARFMKADLEKKKE